MVIFIWFLAKAYFQMVLMTGENATAEALYEKEKNKRLYIKDVWIVYMSLKYLGLVGLWVNFIYFPVYIT